jgi:tRNA(Arg) A34 adenosine deaminase TadA
MPKHEVRDDETGMTAAVAAAEAAIEKGQTPFGSAILRAGAVVASAGNSVWRDTDPSAHAEVNAVRAACRSLGRIDLSDCVLYSTCEPCPMCFTTAHWARIPRIVCGASIADAARAGFNELALDNERIKGLAGLAVELVPGVRAEECRALFERWSRRPGARPY